MSNYLDIGFNFKGFNFKSDLVYHIPEIDLDWDFPYIVQYSCDDHSVVRFGCKNCQQKNEDVEDWLYANFGMPLSHKGLSFKYYPQRWTWDTDGDRRVNAQKRRIRFRDRDDASLFDMFFP